MRTIVSLGMTPGLLVLIVTLFGFADVSAIRNVARDQAQGFETASITRNTVGTTERGSIKFQPKGRLAGTNVTLEDMIKFAYQRHFLDEREVSGGPAWAAVDRFDLLANVPGEHVFDSDGFPRHSLVLLQALLAERFKLQVHEESRDRSVYALVTTNPDGALGPKLRKSDIDCGAVMRGERPSLPGQVRPCGFKTPPGRLFTNTFPMPVIARLLSRHVDRPVIDRTGLSGRFDMELEASEIKAASDYKPGPSDLTLPPAKAPSIFVAVREQLGLKLEPVTAPVALIVISQAERPQQVTGDAGR
jgi:uncharacterized protein (TIGR03435 family)